MSTFHNARSQQPRVRQRRPHSGEQAFQCLNCQQYVCCDPLLAGVQNRNHCPACLWSRHLDWKIAGDRRSACRAAMQPIGLTTKHSRNKYAQERDGELMLIHRCTGCATIVINRIAGDDSAAAIIELFDDSCASLAGIRADLAMRGVCALATADRDLVRRRLFGERL
ncbi:MAG TPA: RNHCP domain-containing protein [Herpetosiphonaceae bacterium]